MELEEFKNENIVEKLIKCLKNKYIPLDYSETNKLVINKLKLDFDRQKRNIKSNYDKRE